MINNHYLNNLGKVVNGKSVTEGQGMLVIGKDGKCTFKVKSQETKWSTEFFNGVRKVEDLADQAYFKSPVDSYNNLKPSTVTTIKGDGSSKVSKDFGINTATGVKMSTFEANDGNGNSVSVGNVNLNAKINNNGVLFGLDANVLNVTNTLIFHENDLYYYQTEFGITVLSASIGGSLTTNGFKLKTPGLIAVSIGIGKVDKIDSNFNN